MPTEPSTAMNLDIRPSVPGPSGRIQSSSACAPASAQTCLGDDFCAALVEGSAQGLSRARAEHHLDGCSSCRELVASLLKASDDFDRPYPQTDLAPTGVLTDPTLPLHRGALVGRYIVLERIGAGGMGVVYAAYDPELDRKVALKLVRAREGSPLTDAQQRLQREAQTLARLSHPNVINVFDVGLFGDQIFVALEFVDGLSLSEWLHESPRSISELRTVFLAAGWGLSAAHASNLIHRDFKPSNVLLGRDGRVRVMDFGLARVGTTDPTPLPEGVVTNPAEPSATHRAGTPAYMAPEQRALGWADTRTDQFSFCASLFEALYGKPPSLSGEPPVQLPLRSASGEKVPLFLRRLLEKGLSPQSAARFESMNALLARLQSSPERHRAMLLVAALVGLLVLAGGLGVLESKRREARQCAGVYRDWAEVWNPGRGQQLKAAFEKSQLSYAADTAERVIRRLDAVMGRGAAQHVQLCEATLGEEASRLETYRLQSECLSERRLEAKALIGLLLHAEPSTIAKSIEAVDQLARLDHCSGGPLTMSPLRSASVDLRARIAPLRAELAEIQTLKHIGRYDQGIARAKTLVASARKVGVRPMVAEALLLLGSLELLGGKHEDGARSLTDAAHEAQAAGADFLAASAHSKLVHAAGYYRVHPELAELHRRQAAAILERIGGDQGLEIDLAEYTGLVATAAGNYPLAIEHQRDVVRRSESFWGPHHQRVGRAHRNLGWALSQAGRFEEALVHQTQSREIGEGELGAEHPQVAQILNHLASTLFELNRLDEGRKLADRSLTLHQASLGPMHLSTSVVLFTLGRIQMMQGEENASLATHRRSLEIVERAGAAEGPYAVQSWTGLADAYLHFGHSRQARDAYARANEVTKKVFGAKHPYFAQTLTGQAEALLGLKDAKQARALLEEALAVYQAVGGQVDAKLIANTQFALARALATSPGNPKRVGELADLARSVYLALGARASTELKQLDQWLAQTVR